METQFSRNPGKTSMKKVLSAIALSFVAIFSMAQTYCNPVIPGFHPDPSICRVGDKYYIVNSSFEYFPGVPVSESTDLVNWKQIGNVLDRDSQIPLKGATSWLGIYAPTIRYDNGTWYMITTNVGNGGNFFVTASKPEGPWSEPIWLKQGGIDPSLYFEGSKCYMCSNPDDAIWLCEIDRKTGRQLTESKQIWKGNGGRYVEGPHIYKKDGWYYLLCSEGGTELAHHLTIARSRNIYGPYISNPDNPILTNCDQKGQSKQIQGTGHGDFVEDFNGNWWIVFLAYRNYNGSYHHLGRETYLAPVNWPKGEWPVVNDGNAIDTLMTAKDLPALNPVSVAHTKSINLTEPRWLYIQNPVRSNYINKEGKLKLIGHSSLIENNQPTFVGVRQTSARFSAETEVAVSPDKGKYAAAYGLAVYQINDGNIKLEVAANSVRLCLKLKSVEQVLFCRELPAKATKVKLRVESDGNLYYFRYSADGEEWQSLGNPQNCSLLSTEVAGGFTGVVVGMYAEKEGEACFNYFDYQ